MVALTVIQVAFKLQAVTEKLVPFDQTEIK